jgi:signal transduction histidine kinase
MGAVSVWEGEDKNPGADDSGGEKGHSRPRPRILLVEDDSGLREAMSVLLTDEGYAVATANDGLTALRMLRAQSGFGLIILDVRMPIMNGWEFRLAQRADADLASIPVIAVSADGSPEAMAIDADLHFQKPFDTQQLLAGVQRLLWQWERKGMEARLEEAERLASLGRVVAGVGHEINNPLAYVTLNVESVRETLAHLAHDAGTDDARQEPLEKYRARLEKLLAAVADCETGLERIRQVASNLRSLSRQSDSLKANVALDEVLDGARAMVRNQVQQRATLVRQYDRLPTVFGHAGRLGQVFVNLLVNAAQSIPEGQQDRHRITVRATADRDQIRVEIEDTGRGIPSDILPHIFEPFFTTRHDDEGGTGLGLSISRQIVLAHGGELAVESRVGRGTVARVTLPVAHGTSSPKNADKPAEPAPSAPKRGRVLVVDDDPLVSRALSSLLRREHDVVERHRAIEALDLLRSGEAFDVILCDVLMPDMDGAAFYEALLRSLPAAADRAIFMTGGAFTPRTSAFVENVKVPVIAKPFDATKLRELVRGRVAALRASAANDAPASVPA